MKKLIAILGLALLGSGCETIGPTTDDCVDPPMTPVNINFVKNSEIRVSPPNVPTRLGNVLKFKLTGDPETTVTVSGKASDPDAAWIKGSGKGGGFIYVCVRPGLDIPADLDEKAFSYDIIVSGIGTLDPVVTVRR